MRNFHERMRRAYLAEGQTEQAKRAEALRDKCDRITDEEIAAHREHVRRLRSDLGYNDRRSV